MRLLSHRRLLCALHRTAVFFVQKLGMILETVLVADDGGKVREVLPFVVDALLVCQARYA